MFPAPRIPIRMSLLHVLIHGGATLESPIRTVRCPTEAALFLADCQAPLAFGLLANTWNAVVLWALRRLEFNGPVDRRAYAAAPPRVECELTERGPSLPEPIRALGAGA